MNRLIIVVSLFFVAVVPTISISAATDSAIVLTEQQQLEHEKYQEMLIAYQLQRAKERLDMSEDIYTKFEPIYREYLNKVNPKPRYRVPEGKLKGKRTDEDIEKFIIEDFKQQKLVAETRLEYYYKLKELFSPQQITALYRSEAHAIRELRDKLHSRYNKSEKGKPEM